MRRTIAEHEVAVVVDVVPAAVVLLAATVGSVVRRDDNELCVSNIARDGECPRLRCLADGVGGVDIIVVEVVLSVGEIFIAIGMSTSVPMSGRAGFDVSRMRVPLNTSERPAQPVISWLAA